MGQRYLKILPDSGTDLSVIRNDALDDRSKKLLTATSKPANWCKWPSFESVSLGSFQVAHTCRC